MNAYCLAPHSDNAMHVMTAMERVRCAHAALTDARQRAAGGVALTDAGLL